MPLKDILERSKKEKKRAQNKDTAKKIGIGIGIGTAIGSTLGLLFAPKSGQETRADIADTTKKTVANIKDSAGEVGEKIQNIVEEGKDRISNIRKNKQYHEVNQEEIITIEGTTEVAEDNGTKKELK